MWLCGYVVMWLSGYVVMWLIDIFYYNIMEPLISETFAAETSTPGNTALGKILDMYTTFRKRILDSCGCCGCCGRCNSDLL